MSPATIDSLRRITPPSQQAVASAQHVAAQHAALHRSARETKTHTQPARAPQHARVAARPPANDSRGSYHSSHDSSERERLEQLWPAIRHYARQYGIRPETVAAVIRQECDFRNLGDKQIEFMARTLGTSAQHFQSEGAAVREWHRGTADMNDRLGHEYQALISRHRRELFP
ncbi:MAG: hypothetical protein ACJ790_02420 [Myxococcaceae bacterium]